MSKPTIIDVEHEEIEATLENRVEALEQHVKMLLESQKNILEHFREMILAVTEISEEQDSSIIFLMTIQCIN